MVMVRSGAVGRVPFQPASSAPVSFVLIAILPGFSKQELAVLHGGTERLLTGLTAQHVSRAFVRREYPGPF
jgi:hypothetical protein